MLKAEFRNGKITNVIILDDRVNGVQGIAECSDCSAKVVLINPDNPSGFASKWGEWIAKEIEIFVFGHHCQVGI